MTRLRHEGVELDPIIAAVSADEGDSGGLPGHDPPRVAEPRSHLRAEILEAWGKTFPLGKTDERGQLKLDLDAALPKDALGALEDGALVVDGKKVGTVDLTDVARRRDQRLWEASMPDAPGHGRTRDRLCLPHGLARRVAGTCAETEGVEALPRVARRDARQNGEVRRAHPAASNAVVAEAEDRLGFPLPSLLRRLYLEVGNGGFGPGFGLLGVEGGHEAEVGNYEGPIDGLYAEMLRDGWPDRLLPICDWGCAIWSCLDCRIESGPIVTQAEGELWALPFTLGAFFEASLDGLDLHAEMFEPGAGVPGINPFTKKPMMFRAQGKPRGARWP